jgi:hypothetical protein
MGRQNGDGCETSGLAFRGTASWVSWARTRWTRCRRRRSSRRWRPKAWVITNTGGAVAVKLTCPTNPGQNTVLRASPPQNSAVRACRNFRIIGTCPVPTAGAADITSLYVVEFGAVPVGKRLFVQASTMVDGFESLPRQFQARVPAA